MNHSVNLFYRFPHRRFQVPRYTNCLSVEWRHKVPVPLWDPVFAPTAHNVPVPLTKSGLRMKTE